MRWKVKRSAVMRKGLVCPVLCKFTGSSGLNPQSEVRQPDTHLFSPAFIYLLSFFDSAVSLSISVCVCLFLLAAFFTLTQAWIIQNDWANSPDVSIITYVFPLVSFSLSTSLAFSTAASSGVIQSSLFPDPLISFQATSVICESVHDEQCFTFSSV